MRSSVRKRMFMCIHISFLMVYTIGCGLFFARLVNAEGPVIPLIIYAMVCILFSYFSVTLRRCKSPLLILSGICLALGIIAILIQVSVARRSLAEAWLLLARAKKPFGFFSFFVTEVYVLFIVISTLLFSAKKYYSFIISVITIPLVSIGIILNIPFLLFLSILLLYTIFILLDSTRIKFRIINSMIPFIAALVFSSIIVLIPDEENYRHKQIRLPDFTELFVTFLPNFPLLRDIPGYGISIGAGEMPLSVFLTSRIIFRVTGEPRTDHYLADARYTNWNGKTWEREMIGDDSIEVTRSIQPGEQYPGELTLELIEDFVSNIPVSLSTTKVVIPFDAPTIQSATHGSGLTFDISAKRGFVIQLIERSKDNEEIIPKIDQPISLYQDVKSEEITELAMYLRQNAKNDHEFIQNLLTYLTSSDFTYSLTVKKTADSTDIVTDFLFNSKEGFCLYFASAFVLLAREGGLNARLVEGYRFSIDEFGEGLISGSSAHAWPEVFLDNGWRIFEPTPPYAGSDPFSYLAEGNSSARRQLELLFGKEKDPAQQKTFFESISWSGLRGIVTLLILLMLAYIVVMILIRVFEVRKTKIRRLSRKIVSKYQKKGIEHPAITGWIIWKEKITKSVDIVQKEKVFNIIDELIDNTFSK